MKYDVIVRLGFTNVKKIQVEAENIELAIEAAKIETPMIAEIAKYIAVLA